MKAEQAEQTQHDAGHTSTISWNCSKSFIVNCSLMLRQENLEFFHYVQAGVTGIQSNSLLTIQ